MYQPIVGYHQDEQGDWVADLACGHGQHVRHQPPFSNRPWVLTGVGRTRHVGTQLNCLKCEEPPIDLPQTSR
jgi:cytochrome c-type biogenesis protein CcmH/NrfF